RHTAYRWLSRVLFPHSYVGKILLLTFAAAHIPLIGLVTYMAVRSPVDRATTISVVAVGLVATLVGSGVAMAGIWVLLTPVASSSRALERYLHDGVRLPLPTDVDDEGGRLMANVHGTLEGLDSTIGQLEELVIRDELTRVYNRREGTRRLLEQVDAGRAAPGELVLILFDADELKAINDQWGHGVGDRVLQRFAGIVAQRVRTHGWVARWGGDEFVAVVWETGADRLAERLIQEVTRDLDSAPLRLAGGEQLRPTMSAGLARRTAGDDLEALFDRADAALYRTKRKRGSSRTRPSARHVVPDSLSP
ncbi:MAG: GGDEF domain-containing protein, partial [Chloroflexia bacterium]|nr:GGDEF domain-containing protein [Chloroflexia bacterium]